MHTLVTRVLMTLSATALFLTPLLSIATETELQPRCHAASLTQAKNCHDGDLFYFVPDENSMAGEINFVNPTQIMTLFCDFRYTIQFTDYSSGIACIYKKKADTDKSVDALVEMVNQQIKEAEEN